MLKREKENNKRNQNKERERESERTDPSHASDRVCPSLPLSISSLHSYSLPRYFPRYVVFSEPEKRKGRKTKEKVMIRTPRKVDRTKRKEIEISCEYKSQFSIVTERTRRPVLDIHQRIERKKERKRRERRKAKGGRQEKKGKKSRSKVFSTWTYRSAVSVEG
jgi:hypothetical protein